MHWDLQTGNRLSKKKCVWLNNKAHSVQFSSVTQSCLILLSHELQHTRPPCPWPTPWVYSNSCPLSRWCHPTISSSVVPFSSCIQSFPASGTFKWVSSSHQVAKGLEFQIQHQSFQWLFRTDFLYDGLFVISLQSKGLSTVFSNTVQKHQPVNTAKSFLLHG